jgi:hypothetical protein
MEIAAVTDEQMSQIQEWVMKHDATVKYIAVVMTMMLVINILQSFGVVPL